MRIALLISSEKAGGSENQMRLLARGLLNAGHKVTIIFTDHDNCRFKRNPDSALDFSGIDCIKLSMRRFYRIFYLPYGRLRIRLKKFDIALACGANTSCIMSALFKNSHTKTVCRLSNLFFSDPAEEAEKNKTITAVSAADTVVSNAQIALDSALAMQILPPEKPHKVIRNTVICHDPVNEPQPGRFHVLFVGRLQPVKDPMTLLKALAIAKKRIPELTGEFIGYGFLADRMQKCITENNWSDFIRITGFVQQDQIPYRGADLLVNCSVSELSSGSIAEALYRGIIVVASNIGGNPELLANREFGALFPAGNAEACAEEIIKFALKTPAERQKIAKQARKFAEESFSLENYIKSYIALFEKMLEKKSL
jgi:glycosyltransferase involved in cell wall biosynthesis